MDRTEYPVDYNYFEIGYCGHPNPPYKNIQLEQASDLILHIFVTRGMAIFHNIFFILDAISESEDNKGVPLFIVPL